MKNYKDLTQKAIELNCDALLMLYYSYTKIVFQEVPNEISLSISISGCPIKCKGCHSSETWNPKFGQELTDKKMIELITKNKHITCVLFFGGEWNPSRLIELLKISKSFNLKTCLYTGLEMQKIDSKIIKNLNFIKTGKYEYKLGGLDKKTTNQRFKNLDTDENVFFYNL